MRATLRNVDARPYNTHTREKPATPSELIHINAIQPRWHRLAQLVQRLANTGRGVASSTNPQIPSNACARACVLILQSVVLEISSKYFHSLSISHRLRHTLTHTARTERHTQTDRQTDKQTNSKYRIMPSRRHNAILTTSRVELTKTIGCRVIESHSTATHTLLTLEQPKTFVVTSGTRRTSYN